MYLFFDTETTGLPIDWNAHVHEVDNWPRLIQLAWIVCDNNGNKITDRSHIIRPEGFEIPEQASSVHGISTEKAEKEGVSLLFALGEFKVAMELSKYLVAHNINFDKKIIGAEFIRKGIEEAYERIKEIDKICTMMSSTKYCEIPKPTGAGFKWPTLMELHTKLFDKGFEEAHDAMADITATVKCFYKLKELEIINN